MDFFDNESSLNLRTAIIIKIRREGEK
jgi:hypothetical protein